MSNKTPDLFAILPFACCLLPFSARSVFTTEIKTPLAPQVAPQVAHRMLASLTLYRSNSFSEKLSGIYLEGREHLIEGKEKLT
ncbi:hypothetical protein [Moorena sp. SIO3I6]|uniref:hypothetical protein n=1 Tax=Moorena sp. SIO3I6 TaxID=2607831 RepID=UPI0013F92647|nr:hypothetical protein [Moorena sp. SIO3I6]NEP27939.1 hypothetical protein [Moorena sp. SIO3I6]